MKAVLVLVGEAPSVVDLPDDSAAAFAKMQSLVGGWLERVRGDRTYATLAGMLSAVAREPVRDVDVYCDEDGHPKGLPPNRAGFIGPFVVIGRNRGGTSLVGLTDEQVTKVMTFFAEEQP